VRPTEDLVEQRELDLPVARATELRPKVRCPEAALAHLFLKRRNQPLSHGSCMSHACLTTKSSGSTSVHTKSSTHISSS
jgi:hypothetical protein